MTTSPWVARALRHELPLTDRQSGRSASPADAGSADWPPFPTSAQLAIEDEREHTEDAADSPATIAALRQLRIVR